MTGVETMISRARVRQVVAVRFFIWKVWHGLSGKDKVEWDVE
jgi:hypothetical protein